MTIIIPNYQWSLRVWAYQFLDKMVTWNLQLRVRACDVFCLLGLVHIQWSHGSSAFWQPLAVSPTLCSKPSCKVHFSLYKVLYWLVPEECHTKEGLNQAPSRCLHLHTEHGYLWEQIFFSLTVIQTRVREIAAAMDNRSVNNRSVTLKYWTPSCPNLPHPFFVGRVGRWMTFQPKKRMGKGSLDLSKVVAEKGV